MTFLGLSEAALLAMLTGVVVMLFPEHFWSIAGSVLVTYAALILLQFRAFHRALSSGLVRPGDTSTGSRRVFFMRPECPNRWLVRRHIRMFL